LFKGRFEGKGAESGEWVPFGLSNSFEYNVDVDKELIFKLRRCGGTTGWNAGVRSYTTHFGDAHMIMCSGDTCENDCVKSGSCTCGLHLLQAPLIKLETLAERNLTCDYFTSSSFDTPIKNPLQPYSQICALCQLANYTSFNIPNSILGQSVHSREIEIQYDSNSFAFCTSLPLVEQDEITLEIDAFVRNRKFALNQSFPYIANETNITFSCEHYECINGTVVIRSNVTVHNVSIQAPILLIENFTVLSSRR